jgi:hypothetical protein
MANGEEARITPAAKRHFNLTMGSGLGLYGIEISALGP